jgi:DNA mismatch repair protein MutL
MSSKILRTKFQFKVVIEHVIEDIENEVPVQGIEQLTHRTLAYLACRSAVKAGDPLTQEQAQVLIEKLLQTPFAFSCPHGRPTLHRLSWNDLEKLFHRR